MSERNWLERYGPEPYGWCLSQHGQLRRYYRRLGLVEGFFDSDGTDFEGRADLNCNLHVEARTALDAANMREKIIKAWSIFRQRHVLLASRALWGHGLLASATSSAVFPDERYFVFDPCPSPSSMLEEASEHVVFVEDHYHDVDARDFYIHLMNSSRPIDASRALAKLFIMPMKSTPEGTFHIHFILVEAHQITDGITLFRWMNDFIDLLNSSGPNLDNMAEALSKSNPEERLPPPQESLYPPVPIGSTTKPSESARHRWHWLISRILRHVRKPAPACFANPLRRPTTLSKAITVPAKYPGVLGYSKVPPLNSFAVSATLSTPATQKLAQLCREAKISVGSGCFTLVGMVMMEFEERRNPNIPLDERLPFVGSFPVNPRPFLAGKPTTGKEDSLMLAFSDGITLPFLPSSLDFDKRFRVLGRLAHRQLRQYQKGKRRPYEDLHIGSRHPSQLLPALYLGSMERLEAKTPPEKRKGWNIQGTYPASASKTLATCGVSSVGDRTSLIAAGKYDISKLSAGTDLSVDFRDLKSAVRVREGEFLVGAAGTKEELTFMVSYDGCAIDPDKAEQWKIRMEEILEQNAHGTKLSARL